MFFSFLAVFPLPESYQNDPKFHFNTLLRSDTQKSSKNVENTTVFWSRCETVFGPPPAKADIATAILTNVIEHLVLLLPPNKHAFTAKAVWADFGHFHSHAFALNGSEWMMSVISLICWLENSLFSEYIGSHRQRLHVRQIPTAIHRCPGWEDGMLHRMVRPAQSVHLRWLPRDDHKYQVF